MELSEFVKKKRKGLNLTQVSLAEKAGAVSIKAIVDDRNA